MNVQRRVRRVLREVLEEERRREGPLTHHSNSSYTTSQQFSLPWALSCMATTTVDWNSKLQSAQSTCISCAVLIHKWSSIRRWILEKLEMQQIYIFGWALVLMVGLAGMQSEDKIAVILSSTSQIPRFLQQHFAYKCSKPSVRVIFMVDKICKNESDV